jgi:hypothetical protein
MVTCLPVTRLPGTPRGFRGTFVCGFYTPTWARDRETFGWLQWRTRGVSEECAARAAELPPSSGLRASFDPTFGRLSADVGTAMLPCRSQGRFFPSLGMTWVATLVLQMRRHSSSAASTPGGDHSVRPPWWGHVRALVGAPDMISARVAAEQVNLIRNATTVVELVMHGAPTHRSRDEDLDTD